MLAFLGTVGGILPDIDLQHTYASRIMFALMGVVAAFLMVFSVEDDLSIVELWAVGMVTFALIRWPVWSLFDQYTTHRGSVHSLVAALLAMFLTVAFTHYLIGKNAFVSWVFGLFVFFGFVLHLVLDEIYSVDFMNYRIKRSFGTALKILDWRKREKSAILVGLTLAAWAITPDAGDFLDTLASADTYRIIGARFLP